MIKISLQPVDLDADVRQIVCSKMGSDVSRRRHPGLYPGSACLPGIAAKEEEGGPGVGSGVTLLVGAGGSAFWPRKKKADPGSSPG